MEPPKLPGRTLIGETKLQERIREMGREITAAYAGQPLTVAGLMNGSLFFMTDLVRTLPYDTRIECWKVASYQGTRSTGRIQGLDALDGDYRGRHLLILDDILDTGLTLDEVQKKCRTLRPASIECCVLLSKKCARSRDVEPKWVGFEIEDRFVIGYGLDLDHQYRPLPMIRVLD